MRAIKFKDANVDFAKNQDEYHTLPALRIGDDNDTIITCYKLTFWERFRVLFKGRIWMSELNFNRSLTPRMFSTKNTDLYTTTRKRKV